MKTLPDFGKAALFVASIAPWLLLASCSDSSGRRWTPVPDAGGGTGTASPGTKVGPTGGTVTWKNVTLEVPPGALAQEVEITISEATDVDTGSLPGGIPALHAGSAVKFSPAGLRFAVPARATMPSTGQGALVVALRDDTSGRIELLRPVSNQGGTLVVLLEHFSTAQPVASTAQPPQVLSVDPPTGPRRGGQLVTIRGQHFRAAGPALQVTFGGASATFANVVTSTFVAASATAPEHYTEVLAVTPQATLAGPVEVRVLNPDGLVGSAQSAYTYDPPPPGLPHHLHSYVPAPVYCGIPFSVRLEVHDRDDVVVSSVSTTARIRSPGPNFVGDTLATITNGVGYFHGITLQDPGLRLNNPTSGYSHYIGVECSVVPLSTIDIAVEPGPPHSLRFATQPTSGFAGSALSVSEIEVLDAYGQRTRTSTSVSLEANGGATPLHGTATVDAVEGRATFADVVIEAEGAVSLTASASGLIGATSAAFHVTRVTPTWRTVGTLSVPRASATAALGPDGKIYVGGTEQQAGTTTCEVIDPRGWTRTSLPGFSTPRRRFALAFAGDGRLYVAGGYDAQGATLETVEAFDFAQGTWSFTTSMLTSRADFQLVATPDGRLWACQGATTSTSSGATPNVEVFDHVNQSWSASTHLDTLYGATSPQNMGYLRHAALATTNGGVVIAGGALVHYSGAWAVPDDGMKHLDVHNGGTSWPGLPRLTIARTGLAGAATFNNFLCFVGGERRSTNQPSYLYACGDFEVHVGQVTTQPFPGLRSPRHRHALVRGPDGRLFAIGGTSPSGAAMDSVEAFGPAVTLSTEVGAVGSSVTVTGDNFAPNASVEILWGGVGGAVLATGNSDADGSLGAGIQFQVPAVSPGTFTVVTRDQVSSFPVANPFTVP